MLRTNKNRTILTLAVFAAAPMVSSAAAQRPVYVDVDTPGPSVPGSLPKDGTSWLKAYPDLRTALDMEAGSTDPIGLDFYIAEGTYLPGTLESDSFSVLAGYRFYGSFLGYDPGNPLANEMSPNARKGSAANTVLSGELVGPGDPGNSDNIVRADGVVVPMTTIQRSEINGLTITEGYADTAGPGLADQGAGLLVTGATGLSVVDVTFRNCTAVRNGGAVSISTSGDIDFSYCTFELNRAFTAGAGGLTGRGGGIYMDDVSAFFQGTTLPVSVFSSRFRDNISAEGGAIAIDNVAAAGVYLVNLLMHDNRAYAGGGIFIGNTDTTDAEVGVSHCTITGNLATAPPGATHTTGGGVYIANENGPGTDHTVNISSSIIWNNRAEVGRPPVPTPEGDLGGPNMLAATVEFSDILQGTGMVGGAVWPGLGNINADPQFVSVALDNYELSPGSPCIDIGDDFPLPSYMLATLAIGDLADLDGDDITAESVPFDIRRFEDREQNILAVPDGGRNAVCPGCDPNISDMGCFEASLNGDDPPGSQ
ncbi:MAG: hypothetical protein AAGA20_01800 [Planctomycetota bacterium]